MDIRLTIPESAEYLEVARSTAWRWAKAGKLGRTDHRSGATVVTDEDLVGALITGLAEPKGDLLATTLHLPPTWRELTDREADEVAAALEKMMCLAGFCADHQALKAIVTGEARPKPIFWKCMAWGIDIASSQQWRPTGHQMKRIGRLMESGMDYFEAGLRVKYEQADVMENDHDPKQNENNLMESENNPMENEDDDVPY